MGSLASRPKAPAVRQQIVYVPAAAPPPAVAQSAQNSAAQAETPADSNNQADAANNAAADNKDSAQNLLNRSRGRISTILTGFRGVLSQVDGGAQGKSLLGE